MSADPSILDPSAMERLHRIGGDRLVGKMLATFKAFAREKVTALTTARDEGRWRDAGDAAHALKSSAGNVGAVALARVSFEVEQAGRAQEAEHTSALIDELVRAHGEAQSALDGLEAQGLSV